MFKEISVEKLLLNPPTFFGDDWLALAVGNETHHNAMTIAWGNIGALWERGSHANRLPTMTCYVRPSRYTKEMMDKAEYYTLCGFGTTHKKELGYLGSHSGRDGDKISAAGLTLVFGNETVWFEEAEVVFICRKLYQAPLLESGFVDKELVEFNYPQRDFHEMYIGEIVKVLVKNSKPDNG